MNWTGADRAERLVAGLVSASFFPLLQAKPLYGRTFLPEEDKPEGEDVVLLSYPLWQGRFGGDPAIVGQRIRLNRTPLLVIGIMPRSFDFPQGVDVWLPISLDEAVERQRKAMTVVTGILARASATATAADLNRELVRLTAVVTNEYPESYKEQGFTETVRLSSQPLQERLTGKLRPVLVVFSGAVGLMLLIVCFTVANLMLARATSRRREIAVRVALGAPRRRIVSQLLTESLLVSLLGGGLGLGFASVAIQVLNTSRKTAIAGLPEISLDWSTAAFALAITVLTGLVFGIAPSLGSLGFGVREALQGESRNASSGAGVRRMRRALVVAQLGVSLTLLIGAGLLTKSFYKLRTTDPGFHPENVLTARINLIGPGYREIERKREFIQDLLRQVKQLPGVEGAAIGAVPPGEVGNSETFVIRNQPDCRRRARPPMRAIVDVGVDYFRVMGMALKQGRLLASSDDAVARPVVLVNEAFARKHFPGESPLGHFVSGLYRDETERRWAEIVGVVGDVRQEGLDREATPSLYRTFLQEPVALRTDLLIRTLGDPAPLIRPVREVVASLDRDAPLFDVRTMEQRLADSIGSRRFDAALTGAFALIAAFLASIGVYGVMSYLVALRTSEIGIRLVLGARRGHVLGLILREGTALALIGIALGVGGAMGLSRYLTSLLYGVGARDPQTFVAAALALFGAVLVACAVPGRRASRVDAAIALRHD